MLKKVLFSRDIYRCEAYIYRRPGIACLQKGPKMPPAAIRRYNSSIALIWLINPCRRQTDAAN